MRALLTRLDEDARPRTDLAVRRARRIRMRRRNTAISFFGPVGSSCHGGDTVREVGAVPVPAIRISLPKAAASPGEARRLVSRFAAENDLTSGTDAALLVVSELVSNAVLHGAEPIDVCVTRDGDLLRIEVSDGGRRADGVAPRSRDDRRPGGRGLHIVNSVARRWGTADTDSGKIVWAEIALSDAKAGLEDGMASSTR
jgi:anti-sigma regulatory factor (Ser/Thr protein kinase)